VVLLTIPRYNVKVDIDNHLRYTDEEYKQHLTVRIYSSSGARFSDPVLSLDKKHGSTSFWRLCHR